MTFSAVCRIVDWSVKDGFQCCSVSLQSSMTAAQRPSLRGSGGHGQSSTCLRRYPAPKALSVRTARLTQTGAAVISTLHSLERLTDWPRFLPLCRCSHQTLRCRTRMAGTWTLQLHLPSICGAQCCCVWRLEISLKQFIKIKDTVVSLDMKKVGSVLSLRHRSKSNLLIWMDLIGW